MHIARKGSRGGLGENEKGNHFLLRAKGNRGFLTKQKKPGKREGENGGQFFSTCRGKRMEKPGNEIK